MTPVGTHPQRLADQIAKRDLAGALDVRRPRCSRTTWGWSTVSSAVSSTTRMRSAGSARASSAPSSVVLPVPAPPEITNASRAAMSAFSTVLEGRVQAPGGQQRGQIQRVGAMDPQRQVDAGHRDRWQHRVQPDPAGQPGVDERAAGVEPAPRRWREPDGQPAHVVVAGESQRLAYQAVAAIGPDLLGTVDEDVGHRRVAQQSGERAGGQRHATVRSACAELVEQLRAQPAERALRLPGSDSPFVVARKARLRPHLAGERNAHRPRDRLPATMPPGGGPRTTACTSPATTWSVRAT